MDEGTAASSRFASPSRRNPGPGPEKTIRWVSSIVKDSVVMRLSAPKGKEEWIALPAGATTEKKRIATALCAVDGCEAKRKYRSVRKFETGGCCLEHLKTVEAGLH